MSVLVSFGVVSGMFPPGEKKGGTDENINEEDMDYTKIRIEYSVYHGTIFFSTKIN